MKWWINDTQSASLEADMGRPETFSALRLTAPSTSVTKILLEVKEGDQWKTVYKDPNRPGGLRNELLTAARFWSLYRIHT
jgi:hypothetical protein